MLDYIDNLAFGDAADLIELKAALAFEIFWRLSRTEECVGDHRNRGDRGGDHAHGNF